MEETRVPTSLNGRTVTSYLYREAAAGHLRGGQPSYLLVLLNLAFNAWWGKPNNDNPVRGVVMRGKSSKAQIAQETCLSQRTVQYALAWLEERGWIDTERAFLEEEHGGSRETSKHIMLRIDESAHRDRAKRRQMYAEMEAIFAPPSSKVCSPIQQILLPPPAESAHQ